MTDTQQPLDPQHLTWARLTLDFGPLPGEVKPAQPSGPVETSIRQELEEMIGLLRQAHQQAPVRQQEEEARIDQLAQDPQKFEDLLQAILGQDQPEERETEPTSQEAPTDSVLDGELPTAQTASTDEVIQALALALVRGPELLVTERQEEGLVAYLLIEEGQQTRTVAVDAQGQLAPGRPLEDFFDYLLEEVPIWGISCQSSASYLLTSSHDPAQGALVLDEEAQVAALVELPMTLLPQRLAKSGLEGSLQAAPADRGWSLVKTDPATLLALIQELEVAAIVAEYLPARQSLTFYLPAEQEDFEQGSVGQWMTDLMGSPDPQQEGTVLSFAWGPSKRPLRSLPEDSEAASYYWELPAPLPREIQQEDISQNLEQLAWLYGLSDQVVNRLANYVYDTQSETGLESSLLALDLPPELYKVLQDSSLIESLVGYRQLDPQMSQVEALSESMTAYPNGTDPVSQVSRELLERPWILAADGLGQLGLSAGLGMMASRRLRRGQGAAGLMAASAFLGLSGLSELALSQALGRLRQKNQMDQVAETQVPEKPQMSLLEELRAAQENQRQEEEARQLAESRAQEPLGQQALDRIGPLVGEGRIWLRRLFKGR